MQEARQRKARWSISSNRCRSLGLRQVPSLVGADGNGRDTTGLANGYPKRVKSDRPCIARTTALVKNKTIE